MFILNILSIFSIEIPKFIHLLNTIALISRHYFPKHFMILFLNLLLMISSLSFLKLMKVLFIRRNLVGDLVECSEIIFLFNIANFFNKAVIFDIYLSLFRYVI